MNSNNDEVLHCPYNKYHRIASSKFQRHLVKCEKNFPSDYKVICPYNATHRLSKSEIEEHINTCPMRRIVEGSYIRPPTTHGMIRPEQNDSTSQIDYNSYWGSQEEI
ncbi:Protein D7 [Atta colombica]|uniref:Protein D7 n=1 Tax=Atta colombica TaxID=520822 RepID=A0A151HYE8_9HYME|nr:PREDICTED: gametocyte-specific factor 1-like isoform X1 [Atta colombica]KYM76412.1 Protein D7 [Atta colombica]